MKVRADFVNPYADGLLRVAFDQGKRARLRGEAGCQGEGVSKRTQFAFRAGYRDWRWHRSPNGQVKWHKGG